MYGAIIGDVIGSTYEFKKIKIKDFELFPEGSNYTDDTIMTVAVGAALMEGLKKDGDLEKEMIHELRQYGRRYPHPLGAYGNSFNKWLRMPRPKPYYSCGNGSAMRVSPCALAAQSLEETLELARQSAVITHDHPEGIKGAQATAAAVFLARSGADKDAIRSYITENYYPLDKSLKEIRPMYRFEPSCQKSVPESIEAFLESEDFEDAIRNVISLGGDADTMGAITGAIAWEYYGKDGITTEMRNIWMKTEQYLPEDLKEQTARFYAFCKKRQGISAL